MRADRFLNPADAGETHQFVDGPRPSLQIELQRLEGDIETELVPVLEAVGHGLSRAVHTDADVIQIAGLDSSSKAFPVNRNTRTGECSSRGVAAPRLRAMWTS